MAAVAIAAQGKGGRGRGQSGCGERWGIYRMVEI